MRRKRRQHCDDTRPGDEYLDCGDVALLFDNPTDQRQGLVFVDGVPVGGFNVHPVRDLNEKEAENLKVRGA